MKKRSKFYGCFILVLAGLIISCSQLPTIPSHPSTAEVATGHLHLLLTLNKDVFSPGEYIWASLVLENDGSESLWVNNRLILDSIIPDSGLSGDVYFVITDPSGQELPFDADVDFGFLDSDDFVELNPHKILGRSYDLMPYYYPTNAGKYMVQGIYINQYDPRNNLADWQGEIRSNVVTFILIP